MAGRIVALLLIAGFALAGCDPNGPPDPRRFRSSVSPPASPPTATAFALPIPDDVPRTGPNLRFAGESPPAPPQAATAHTTHGAVEFARFFLLTIDWGYATTSSAYLNHYYEPSCAGCRIAAASLDKLAHEQRHVVGGRYHLHTARSHDANTIRVTADVADFKEVDQHNRFVRGGEGHVGIVFDVICDWIGDHWSVSSLRTVT